MMGSGTKENSTGKVYFATSRAVLKKAYGKMGKKLNDI